MATITIDEVGEPRPYDSSYGPMVAYLLTFSGNDARGQGEISQKPTSPTPQVGESLEVEILPGRVKDEETGERWPQRLKRVKQPAPAGVSGRPMDPARESRIVRQHSQEMALLHVAAMERRAAAKGTDLGSLNTDLDLGKLKSIIDWYQRDAENAKPLGDQS